MNDSFEIELNNPLTKEDWDKIADTELEKTEKIWFKTPSGKKIEFVPAKQWIPVSERLPEVMDGSNGECSDDVLICVADDEQITISTGFYGYYPQSKLLQGWWSVWACGCEQLDSKYKVVAWMPLPEPYKERMKGVV